MVQAFSVTAYKKQKNFGLPSLCWGNQPIKQEGRTVSPVQALPAMKRFLLWPS